MDLDLGTQYGDGVDSQSDSSSLVSEPNDKGKGYLVLPTALLQPPKNSEEVSMPLTAEFRHQNAQI